MAKSAKSATALHDVQLYDDDVQHYDDDVQHYDDDGHYDNDDDDDSRHYEQKWS
jgi:hypothetical protein